MRNEAAMKNIAGIAVAVCIAAVGIVWFMSSPIVGGPTMQPDKPSAAVPTFQKVKSELQGPGAPR
jgi:hypothetical protein